MAIHSRILAWKISWMEESGRLLSLGSQRVGHDWSDLACMHGQRLADAGIRRPPPVSKWDYPKGHPAPELPVGLVLLPAHSCHPRPLTGIFPKNTPHWTFHTRSPTQAACRSQAKNTQLLLLINKHSNLSNSYWTVLSKDWTFIECILFSRTCASSSH